MFIKPMMFKHITIIPMIFINIFIEEFHTIRILGGSFSGVAVECIPPS